MMQPERTGARRADAFNDASRIIKASLSAKGRGHLSRLSSAALLLLWHYHYTGDHYTPVGYQVPGGHYPGNFSGKHSSNHPGDYYISGAPGYGYSSSDYPLAGNNNIGD